MPVTLARLADISCCAFVRLSRDRNSHIYQHLQQSQACRGLANKNSFSIVDCEPNRSRSRFIIFYLIFIIIILIFSEHFVF